MHDNKEIRKYLLNRMKNKRFKSTGAARETSKILVESLLLQGRGVGGSWKLLTVPFPSIGTRQTAFTIPDTSWKLELINRTFPK